MRPRTATFQRSSVERVNDRPEWVPRVVPRPFVLEQTVEERRESIVKPKKGIVDAPNFIETIKTQSKLPPPPKSALKKPTNPFYPALQRGIQQQFRSRGFTQQMPLKANN